jgi:hypothetical protein
MVLEFIFIDALCSAVECLPVSILSICRTACTLFLNF